MRVLQVLASLNKNSGIANVVMNWYRNIDRSQFEFDYLVFWRKENTYEEEVKSLGGNVYFIERPTVKTYFSFVKEVSKFMEEHGKDYDVIHCHEILFATIFRKFAKKAGKKYVLHSHSTKFSETLLKSIRNKLLFFGAKKGTDYFLACSKDAGTAVFGKNILKKDNFSVLYNGIDLQRFKFDINSRNRIREELGIDKDCVLLGAVGRLDPQKNCSFMLETLYEYKKINPSSRLVFVGDGIEKEKLVTKVKELNLSDSVFFVGIQSDVKGYLSAMDCFLFPSLFEGLGVAAVEAQTNGLPCLLSEYVPQEAIVVGCKQISLDAKEWANNIEVAQLEGREEAYKNIGVYDIASTTESLKKCYYEIMGDK